MKEVIRQTTEARVDFHDRYWKRFSDEGTPGTNRVKNALIRLSRCPSQQRTSSLPFSIPTLHVGSSPSKCRCIHGSRASRLRRNTTSAAYARTLTRVHVGVTRSGRRGPCRALRKVTARTITTKRTSWYSVPPMKTISGAEAGRRRHARRRNRTPRDNGNTSLLHRRMITRYGAG